MESSSYGGVVVSSMAMEANNCPTPNLLKQSSPPLAFSPPLTSMRITIRLGWRDAGTYDKNIEEWPTRGGADGSLRFEVEQKHAANAGLINALKLIQLIKDKYLGITYADLFQLASATAVEEAGGPKIPLKYGRVDISGPDKCPEEGRLPDFTILLLESL